MKKNKIGKYSYKVEWSEDDDLYLATCQEFPFLMAHGKRAMGYVATAVE